MVLLGRGVGVGAGKGVKQQRLKTGFLSRTIKLLTDPVVPGVTRTHAPRTTLGEALIALWGSISWGGRKEGVEYGTGCVQCTSTQFMSTWRCV